MDARMRAGVNEQRPQCSPAKVLNEAESCACKGPPWTLTKSCQAGA